MIRRQRVAINEHAEYIRGSGCVKVGQSGATTLQAQNGDEVVVAGIGEPPSWVILGIVER